MAILIMAAAFISEEVGYGSFRATLETWDRECLDFLKEIQC